MNTSVYLSENLSAFASWLCGEGKSRGTTEKYLRDIRTLAGVDIRVKFVKVQQKLFREQSKDLTQAEYHRLVETAYSAGNERLALLMETICYDDEDKKVLQKTFAI